MKKFTALMLVLMMIATGLAAIFTASAEDVVTVVEREIPAEAKKWYDDNPAASEFTISNAAELAYLSVLTNQNTPETFSNKTVKLANDIVWNDGTPTSGGFIPAASQNNTIYKWTPISQKKVKRKG